MTNEQKINRDDELVKLIRRVKKSPFRPTAVKVEMEGRLGREFRCKNDCSFRLEDIPHVGCKAFDNVNVAHDYVLQYLAKFGLAERVPEGHDHPRYSYMYMAKYPCAFSKIYTDSETEWTITIRLDEAENILLLPHLVDAFNRLKKANGNGVDVTGSGMHTAFLQGEFGAYPSYHCEDTQNQKRFKNFQKSMTPLLPALYLLGSRTYRGKGITRSFSPRIPIVSSRNKYSAIAYRAGALEFRVFDTCYGNREQILDNVAVMARCVSKYWRKKYRNPGMDKYMKTPVLFGGYDVRGNSMVENLYMMKEQIQLLNAGLKRIKPPYLTIKQIKASRGFKRTLNNCFKPNTFEHQVKYEKYMQAFRWEVAREIARSLYVELDCMDISTFEPDTFEAIREKVSKRIQEKKKAKSIDMVVYEQEFGQGFVLGGE